MVPIACAAYVTRPDKVNKWKLHKLKTWFVMVRFFFFLSVCAIVQV